MHLLSPTGPVTTCTGAPVETAAERGADATANVLAVDCIPCLRKALVESLRARDALAKDLAVLRAGLRLTAQEMQEAVSDMRGGA